MLLPALPCSALAATHWRNLMLIACSLAAVPARAAEAPVTTPLFGSGKGGYHTYRIPALILTARGTLLAFCEGRKAGSSDAGEIDLLMRRSQDNGKTWEPQVVVVKDGSKTCGNPCPMVDRDTGTIVLLLCKNGGGDREDLIVHGSAPPRTVWVTTSNDDGVTWSTPREISDQVRKPGWRWYATGPGHGTLLASGRLVAPCDYADGAGEKYFHSHVIYSDDHGQTWHIGGALGPRVNECTAAELSDGSLYLNMRSYRGKHRRDVATSTDEGMTWSPIKEDPTLPEPVCQASVLRLRDVNTRAIPRFVFSNPAGTKRERMTVRLSQDDCRTWYRSRVLWEGPAAYSDLVHQRDGRIGCLFECGQTEYHETITYAQFAVEWLMEGEPAKP